MRPSEVSEVQVFAFRFQPAYALAGLPFGVTARTTRAAVTDDSFVVRFGPWHLSTPLANIVSTDITGPYRFHRTAGPAHLSLSDHGVTFATNGRRGLCIVLDEPVKGISPWGGPYHPSVTVTVAEPEALQDALRPGRVTR